MHRGMKIVVCRLIGHDWEVVRHIPAPESLPGGVPVEKIRCRRCGETALRTVLKPGQTVSFPQQRGKQWN